MNEITPERIEKAREKGRAAVDAVAGRVGIDSDAFDRLIALERAEALWAELKQRKPKAEPRNHGGRCWWCRWKAEAYDALIAAIEAIEAEGVRS